MQTQTLKVGLIIFQSFISYFVVGCQEPTNTSAPTTPLPVTEKSKAFYIQQDVNTIVKTPTQHNITGYIRNPQTNTLINKHICRLLSL